MFQDYLKTFPQYITPKLLLTQFAGLMASTTHPRIKNYLISRFVAKYAVNMAEAIEENPLQYASFNDFFIRHLKPELRPIADAPVVSPVDGVVSELGNIEQGRLLQAKGRYYTVNELLAAHKNYSALFQDGKFITLYLSPKDYHRVHMPIEGSLQEMIYVPGRLFSVQPSTARVVPKLFARNERLICLFDTPIGSMAMVLVGATIVSSIGTSWSGDLGRHKAMVHRYYNEDQGNATASPVFLPQGAEMGYFKLGSTVILLFTDKAQLAFRHGLQSGESIRFGEPMLLSK